MNEIPKLPHLLRVHNGPFVDMSVHDDGYGDEFLAGYLAARDWFAIGAYVQEANELAEIWAAHRPGGPKYELAAALYLDAAKFPSFLMAMNSRAEPYTRKYGQRFPVRDGKDLTAAFVEDYGGSPAEWVFPARAFTLCPSRPFDEGVLVAVNHVLGRD
ncbi:hypothetical protein [Nonomuraea wenchangensis]|uniref:hypothetical protein n=1 Tax=Nonomuraea wenchangensis TaxID=568860 RepID=UPI0033240E7C